MNQEGNFLKNGKNEEKKSISLSHPGKIDLFQPPINDTLLDPFETSGLEGPIVDLQNDKK